MVELIIGNILQMSPAPMRQRKIVSANIHFFLNFFDKHKCKIYIAPFDVCLFKSKDKDDDKVETVA